MLKLTLAEFCCYELWQDRVGEQKFAITWKIFREINLLYDLVFVEKVNFTEFLLKNI